MKKFTFITILLLISVSFNAQTLHQIKQIALNAYKSTLYAPSKFILCDCYGNKITVDKLKAYYVDASIKTEQIQIKDSIFAIKKRFEPYYNVVITGDTMVLGGGYKHVIEHYSVCRSRAYDSDSYLRYARYDVIEKKFLELDTTYIYDAPEQCAQFEGGNQALLDYISNHMTYPFVAYENGIQGRVIVKFVVGSDGYIKDVNLSKTVFYSLDEEAIRIVKSMPKWIPAKHYGRNVPSYCAVSIIFDKENYQKTENNSNCDNIKKDTLPQKKQIDCDFMYTSNGIELYKTIKKYYRNEYVFKIFFPLKKISKFKDFINEIKEKYITWDKISKKEHIINVKKQLGKVYIGNERLFKIKAYFCVNKNGETSICLKLYKRTDNSLKEFISYEDFYSKSIIYSEKLRKCNILLYGVDEINDFISKLDESKVIERKNTILKVEKRNKEFKKFEKQKKARINKLLK